MKTVNTFLYAVFFFFVSAFTMVHAADHASQPPLELLRTVSSEMLSQLKSHSASIKKDQDRLYSIVQRVLIPHVAKEKMSIAVIGPRYWSQATASQRETFMQEFIRLVTRTYATALSSYDNLTVRFLPIRENIAGKTRLQINSLVLHAKGPAIPVNYRLVLLNGQWKVYDFSVEHVSLVQSYASQFASILAQKGLQGLLDQLTAHNRKG